MRRTFIAAVVVALMASSLAAQRPKTPVKKTPAKTAATKTVTPDVKCPSLIGMGVKTVRSFCDVLAGRDPSEGIVVSLPPHSGEGTLTFDLHNRHTYSEEQVRANRAFARYTAVIGALTMDNTLISRAAIQSAFTIVVLTETRLVPIEGSLIDKFGPRVMISG